MTNPRDGPGIVLAAIAAVLQNPLQPTSHETGETTVAKPAPRKMPTAGALSLKVTLRDIKPPVWRRIWVPGSTTLAGLHVAIQAAMGWYNCHLHDFDVGGMRYGDPDGANDFDDDLEDENRLRLSALVKSGVNRFRYTYDYGDRWQHEILIEKAPPSGPAGALPACVAGQRNCPPEDSGGPWGYAELLEILADPAHPRHDELLEWVGGEFDPEAFSVEDADATLAAAFGRKEAGSF